MTNLTLMSSTKKMTHLPRMMTKNKFLHPDVLSDMAKLKLVFESGAGLYGFGDYMVLVSGFQGPPPFSKLEIEAEATKLTQAYKFKFSEYKKFQEHQDYIEYEACYKITRIF